MLNEIDLNKKKELLELLKLNSSKGIKYIFTLAYQILGNPMVLIDLSHKLLENTENIVTDDPIWNEIISLGKFSHETVDFFFKELFVDAYAKTDGLAPLKSEKLKYDRTLGTIFDKDGIQTGSLTVIACHKPFVDEDFIFFQEICEAVSNVLQNSKNYQKVDRAFEKTFINELIDGKITDKTSMENKMKDLYADLKSNLYVAVVDIVKYDQTLTHLLYFRDLFKNLQSEYKYFVYLNNIVIIISTDDQLLNIKRDLNNLNRFFIKYNIFAGISSSFQNLFELKKYYKQALNALNYGMNTYVDQPIFKFDDFRADYMLNTISKNTNLMDLYNPIIAAIQEYDKKNNKSYYNILCAHLLSGLNSHLTSSRTKIEHDELCVHLQEISEIFGIDWNNGNTLLSIFISIKISDFLPS